MCIGICAYICLYSYECMYVRMSVHACMFVYVYIYSVCVCMCMCVCVCVGCGGGYIYVSVCVIIFDKAVTCPALWLARNLSAQVHANAPHPPAQYTHSQSDRQTDRRMDTTRTYIYPRAQPHPYSHTNTTRHTYIHVHTRAQTYTQRHPSLITITPTTYPHTRFLLLSWSPHKKIPAGCSCTSVLLWV